MLITWRLGGGRFAQALAGLALLVVADLPRQDSLLTMNAFEPLFWMGCVYVVVRDPRDGDSRLLARLWRAPRRSASMNKHSTVFFGVAVARRLCS